MYNWNFEVIFTVVMSQESENKLPNGNKLETETKELFILTLE